MSINAMVDATPVEAKHFYQANRQALEVAIGAAIDEMLQDQPSDPLRFLADFFCRKVTGKSVADLEAELKKSLGGRSAEEELHERHFALIGESTDGGPEMYSYLMAFSRQDVSDAMRALPRMHEGR